MDRACQSISNPIFFPPHLLASYAKGLGYAALTTVGLIFLMSQLVATDFVEPTAEPLASIKPIHITEKKVFTTKEFEAPPEPQEIPPPPQPTAANKDVTILDSQILIHPPVISGEGGPMAATRDPLPVYKPAPRYPSAALRRGIEGYVIVEFTVTKTGAVRDARVVGGFDSEGNPTNVFNRSSLAAAERFKYRPQMKDGQPVERYGVRNRISYKLAE
ncbi:energy transducer TonB [Microbulbifer sp. OS29]|uniref:Protein TonB n=1 Tax=Microbulbifer okhotskensis TaxID=2926617 RepID=A0A9X2EJH5_9GAMM|nr:energy transducer TonB [Microbulbifer okhotskensis]MCO1333377.1 energy transducer TonB [Microbulbifer okhotskensis]